MDFVATLAHYSGWKQRGDKANQQQNPNQKPPRGFTAVSLCLQYHQRVNGMYVMWIQPGYSQHLAEAFFLTLIGHFSSSHLISPLLWMQIGSASSSWYLEHISGLLIVTISSSKKGMFRPSLQSRDWKHLKCLHFTSLCHNYRVKPEMGIGVFFYLNWILTESKPWVPLEVSTSNTHSMGFVTSHQQTKDRQQTESCDGVSLHILVQFQH